MPVNFYVSHHTPKSAGAHSPQNPSASNLKGWRESESHEQACALRSATVKPAMKYEVSSWLALRASVLRRAVSSSSAAQERRAAFTASLFSELIEAHTQDSCQPLAFAIAPQSQCGVANKMQHRLLHTHTLSVSALRHPHARLLQISVTIHRRQ